MIVEKIVLCVDDDELYLRMLASYLQAYGYAVVSETRGSEALKRAAERQFSAAVLDGFLPDMEVDEIANEVSRLQPTTPVLICTGSKNALPADARAVASAVLSKESGVEALVAALERVTARTRKAESRRFVRYQVEFPFTLRPMHSKATRDLRGCTTSLAEGGLGGRVEGEVTPGENVLIRFLEPHLKSLKAEAQVLYRVGDIYGFEFLRLGSRQRARLRQSFERCLVN